MINILDTKIIINKRTNKIPKISLCIPTNGISEWVFPVLDSIYSQNILEEFFEVIVMDNGNNDIFFKDMSSYAKKHKNIIYAKTNAYEFMSEIEAYKQATGILIKFVNHRTKLLSGSLEYFLNFIEKYSEIKPSIYFSNSVIARKKSIKYIYNNFNDYVRELSYWSSWSTGIAFWKSDFEKINLSKINKTFPHTEILFLKRNESIYIIDNSLLLEEMPVKNISKGKYNLFKAFAVEYLQLILQLYLDNSINKETFLKIKKDNLDFVSLLYMNFIIRKKQCSYDLSDYKNSINIFYGINTLRFNLIKLCISKIFRWGE